MDLNWPPPWFWPLLGLISMAVSTALAGFYNYANRKSLVSDSMAHSLLPGASLGYWLSDNARNPSVMLLGLATAWLSVLLIRFIRRQTKLPLEACIGFSLAVFYSFGILIWNHLNRMGMGGLDSIFFGQIATLNPVEALLATGLALFSVFMVFRFHRAFVSAGFDEQFARISGISTGKLQLLQYLWLSFTVALGIRASGLILVTAWLTMPALIAGHWHSASARRLLVSVFVSLLVGLFTFGIGFYVKGFPTGPWAVLLMGMIYLLQWPVSQMLKKRC